MVSLTHYTNFFGFMGSLINSLFFYVHYTNFSGF
jgi:hypothetical protein